MSDITHVHEQRTLANPPESEEDKPVDDFQIVSGEDAWDSDKSY
jgi:hypothetical protein